jgi:glyoxylase-like metal-dependent hydrolase (beta-lactamase superfamily II)
VPGVRAIPAPGHTPGHIVLVISSAKEQMGRTEFLTATINSEPRLESASQLLERNGALLRVHAVLCSKTA